MFWISKIGNEVGVFQTKKKNNQGFKEKDGPSIILKKKRDSMKKTKDQGLLRLGLKDAKGLNFFLFFFKLNFIKFYQIHKNLLDLKFLFLLWKGYRTILKKLWYPWALKLQGK